MKAHRMAVAGVPTHAWRAAAVLVAALAALPAQAQNFPITPAQRSTAQQVAQAGVPLSELAANAPDSYTVKIGDTLWAISKMYLVSPWRWPELWGMNMQEVRNPHRIYPGQILVLEKVDGRARLRVQQAGGQPATDTIRVSPRVRYQSLADTGIPTLQSHLIDPFLAEPLIVDEGTLERAPRIVAAPDERVLLTRGDRVYARASAGTPMAVTTASADEFRIFRNAVPLRDPYTRVVLGYEAQYLGKASLVRGESSETVVSGSNQRSVPVPATLDILSARGEMRVGDRLLPEPPRELVSYTPRAPELPVEGGAVVSIYGDAVALAGQNQVVVINKGIGDGMEPGHVLAILQAGNQLVDRSQPGERTAIKLPNERNGLMMVFRAFDRVSYALVLETNQGVKVGDRVVSPR
ncbi:MAG TPA: LysM domain-containing protein [Ramlibacter sp.]|jgi:nucleoid-associated protein YgaU|uniref:LysM peptidoglycan-binding domain-containing protein n=1 Tax=Ramlibacter sp. TaxID=1917967 RepID=UPI002D27B408|nr:LysM domain-containing protein [Ramlibacter sp.]HZY17100.1 LysM domain-containing protein [Ramlibacter sp.]